MKSEQTRSRAEQLFIRQGRTLDLIAEELGVSKGTLARWSADGGWSAKRDQFRRQSKVPALEKLCQRRMAIVEAMSSDPNVDPTAEDRLAKIQKVIESLESKDSIGPVLDAMEKFAEYVAANADDVAVSSGVAQPPPAVDHLSIIRAWIDRFLAEERRKNA